MQVFCEKVKKLTGKPPREDILSAKAGSSGVMRPDFSKDCVSAGIYAAGRLPAVSVRTFDRYPVSVGKYGSRIAVGADGNGPPQCRDDCGDPHGLVPRLCRGRLHLFRGTQCFEAMECMNHEKIRSSFSAALRNGNFRQAPGSVRRCHGMDQAWPPVN